MKELINAFNEKFKHPILSTVYTTFLIRNFDIIYPLVIASFSKSLDAMESLESFYIVLDLESNRYVIPILAGGIIGLIFGPLVDLIHGMIVATAMRIKENFQSKESYKTFAGKLSHYQNQVIELVNQIENGSMELVLTESGSAQRLKIKSYRIGGDIEIGQVVIFDIGFCRIFPAPIGTEKVAGVVVKKMNEIAFVAESGIITDLNFIQRVLHLNSPNSLMISKRGFLAQVPNEAPENRDSIVATVAMSGSGNGIGSMSVTMPLDESKSNLPTEKRIFISPVATINTSSYSNFKNLILSLRIFITMLIRNSKNLYLKFKKLISSVLQWISSKLSFHR
ncbi:hypothetical protein AB3N59_19715 [Leptospira sp. WS92.C1]